ncbi:rRNA-binding ribosome biosynthesis protein utp25 [Spiromyces aspiralis]|uniref:rRNA-binding ribosome biosynthesis protein utp25 n=1 Tax=Spiromyces aspiralis TaxID=68401 RepID=A0ACC1HU67_9FUNG|nr:rRNA-binding ribosome biosynthesis protein utp25 [Spiromyces aspiralis]
MYGEQIGADGYHSRVRKFANIAAQTFDYQQFGLVANLHLEAPNCNAFQRFLPTGPIALLPFPDAQANLVWSLPSTVVPALKALPDDLFSRLVNAAFALPASDISFLIDLAVANQSPDELEREMQWRWEVVPASDLSSALPPRATAITPRSRTTFPLRMLNADRYIGPYDRVALVGEAAHVMHPLAGLGLNAGLGDAEALEKVLAEALRAGEDLGDPIVLQKYNSKRYILDTVMQGSVDKIWRLFGVNSRSFSHLRSCGMNLIDRVPLFKPAKLTSRQRKQLREYGELDPTSGFGGDEAGNDLDSAISRALSNKMSRSLTEANRELKLKRIKTKHDKDSEAAVATFESEDEVSTNAGVASVPGGKLREERQNTYSKLLESLGTIGGGDNSLAATSSSEDEDSVGYDDSDDEEAIAAGERALGGDSDDDRAGSAQSEEEEDAASDSNMGSAAVGDKDSSEVSEEEGEGGNESELDGENENGDPYHRHFGNETADFAARVARVIKNDYHVTRLKGSDPYLHQVFYYNTAASKGGRDGDNKLLQSLSDDVVLSEIPVVRKLAKNWEAVEKPYLEAERGATMTPLQSRLFHMFSEYRDVFYANRTFRERQELMDAYALHSLNHILKTRRLVNKNNAKIAKAREAGKEIDDLRDQGFTRPKVLVVLPFRNSAFSFVQTICKLAGVEKVVKLDRFLEEFGVPSDEETGDDPKKPDEFNALFSGNIDDSFRIGIKIMPKAVQLYSPFYSSDIIVVSPLGLRLASGKKQQQEYDFLSSIEVLVMDQCDALLMQNWQHVKHLFKHLNHIPKSARDADFSRIRPWYLDGSMKYYRQTLFFSDFITPELQSLFNNSVAAATTTDSDNPTRRHKQQQREEMPASAFLNYAGKLRIRKLYPGVIADVIPQSQQTFTRLKVKNHLTAEDERFDYFVQNILPALQKSPERVPTLVFIPSYFDYVRVRNYMLDNELNFEEACEYSSPREVSRARTQFYHSRTDYLICTERFHFFHRYTIRGIRRIVFYGLPDHAHYYTEFLDMAVHSKPRAALGNDGSAGPSPAELSCTALFTTYDQLRLERIVGTRLTKQLLGSKNSQFTFT